MEHTRLKPIQGSSAREKTAFTMKTIKELLAEEGAELDQQPAPSAAAPEIEVKAEEVVAPAPRPAPEPKAASLPPITPVHEPQTAAQQEQKRRSFLGSIIGR